jgi:glycosyltransferase involved in cell wall biosynthesis
MRAVAPDHALRPLRLLTLVQKAVGIAPNQRFRHEQWAPHLAREHGITLEFEPFESPELTSVLYEHGQVLRKARLAARDALRRWSSRTRAAEFDGVVVLREAMLVGGAWLEGHLARRGVPLLYDFDDAIWEWELGGRNGVMTLARMPWKVGAICRHSAAVTVGNEYLADFARRHAAEVHVVRTSIDVDRFPEQAAPAADAPFTVVWTGSHSTLRHLERIRPALERLGARRALRLRVICDARPAPFRHVELDFVPWRAATEAADLAAGHVGVMPLPDTAFTRGKCGCKALQYMAIGRPAVVAPVGINREIVRDGENGAWADGDADWERVLARLADDPAERARLGAAGRRTVLDGFTAASSAGAFAGVARRVLPIAASSGSDRGRPGGGPSAR